MIYSGAFQGKNITATTTFTWPTGGQLGGIFCSSATASPTLKVADGTTTKVNTFTPVAGTFYPIPLDVAGNLVVTVGGTLDCCVFARPNS